MSSIPTPRPLESQPALRAVLDRLHALSLEQERENASRGIHFPKNNDENKAFEEQLVALDEDKAQFVYSVLRAKGAKRVIEAGTSYGVSLLWLLAAVSANESTSPSPSSLPALVIGTEYEPSKAARAHDHVKEAFGSTPSFLSILEGDILKTIPAANIADNSIDCLLLDIWAYLALPTLKNVLPKLRIGAVVFIDNTLTEVANVRYKELLEFTRARDSGFETTTLPFSAGMDMLVYVGK